MPNLIICQFWLSFNQRCTIATVEHMIAIKWKFDGDHTLSLAFAGRFHPQPLPGFHLPFFRLLNSVKSSISLTERLVGSLT